MAAASAAEAGTATGEAWHFPGFVAGGAAVALPRELFVELLPRIEDEGELRATLYALAAALRPGPVLGVRRSQLLSERPLLSQFDRLTPGESTAAATIALGRAVSRGSLLAVELPDGDLLYVVHSEAGRRQRERLVAGALTPPAAPAGWHGSEGARRAAATARAVMPGGVAALYESEIGMLTPFVAEALAAAEARYPARWIEDALREAALHNARSWAYAEAMLRRWEAEGRDDAGGSPDEARPGSERGDRDANAGRDTGRDPYQRVVRRSWP